MKELAQPNSNFDADCFSIASKTKTNQIDSESGLITQSQKQEYLALQKAMRKNQKGKIIILEDESSISMIISKALSNAGYQVFLTTKGEETLQIFHSHLDSGNRIDLAILDVSIPNGLGAQDIIRDMKRVDRNLKTIVTSGYTSDAVMLNCNDHGFSAALAKPFSLLDLLTKVRTLLDF